MSSSARIPGEPKSTQGISAADALSKTMPGAVCTARQEGTMTTIRLELPTDIPQVRLVNELAFGQPAEAELVDRLRQTWFDALSLVPEVD